MHPRPHSRDVAELSCNLWGPHKSCSPLTATFVGGGLTQSEQNSTSQEDLVGKVNQPETEPESARPGPHPSWVVWWLCFPRTK